MKNTQKKTKKNKVLLIDGNNLLHRSYHQFSSMKGPNGNSSMIFGFPYILNSLINLHRPKKVYVVFDGGKDKRRIKICPDYKKRPKREDFDIENFLLQKRIVEELTTALGIPYYWKKDHEADDFIYLLARKHSRNNQVVIVSTDKDFNQLINKNISVWNPFSKKRLTHLSLLKDVGYTPEQCVDYLCLCGDTSDNIDGIKGVGDKTAKSFINKFKSIKNFLYSNVPEKEIPRAIPKTLLHAVWERNRELIDIPFFVKKHNIKLKDATFVPGKFNAKEVRFICSDHGITKIIQPQVLETFKTLTRQ